VIALVQLTVDFVYSVVMTATFGGTPGKRMLGLRVIRTDGSRIDLPRAFLRWSPSFGLAVAGLLGNVPVLILVGLFAFVARFVLLIVNLVLVLSDDRRRDVFDRIAGTYVIASS
jgi:uncharacterized RDD family membrane protein YckC